MQTFKVLHTNIFVKKTKNCICGNACVGFVATEEKNVKCKKKDFCYFGDHGGKTHCFDNSQRELKLRILLCHFHQLHKLIIKCFSFAVSHLSCAHMFLLPKKYRKNLQIILHVYFISFGNLKCSFSIIAQRI